MKKILIAGPVFSRSGYGEHARFVVDSLSTRPDLFDLYIYPLEWGNSNWSSGNLEKKKYYESLLNKTSEHLQKSKSFDVHVQVTVPNEWTTDLAPCNIGVTAGVETDRLPDSWKPKILEMDKIIVTSEHIKGLFDKAIGSSKDIQVESVSYPVKDLEPADLSEELKLPDPFNFLTVAQYAPRKNLMSTIKCFVEEFRDEEVGLVVKTHMRNNSYADWCQLKIQLAGFLNQMGPRKCNVHFISGAMSDEEMHGLYVHPKIHSYVTTTHGEGFGLPIFESAYSGLPVIAPAWSGQLDFLYAPFTKKTGKVEHRAHFEKIPFSLDEVHESHLMPGILEKGMKWCYINEDKFKKSLRKVYRSIAPCEETANSLKKHLLDNFSSENQLSHMVQAIAGGVTEEEELVVDLL